MSDIEKVSYYAPRTRDNGQSGDACLAAFFPAGRRKANRPQCPQFWVPRGNCICETGWLVKTQRRSAYSRLAIFPAKDVAAAWTPLPPLVCTIMVRKVSPFTRPTSTNPARDVKANAASPIPVSETTGDVRLLALLKPGRPVPGASIVTLSVPVPRHMQPPVSIDCGV
jgi:hypothetical protein